MVVVALGDPGTPVTSCALAAGDNAVPTIRTAANQKICLSMLFPLRRQILHLNRNRMAVDLWRLDTRQSRAKRHISVLVPLTTAGIVDITPIHPLARSLTNLEAGVGQLYPATLLARLATLQIEGE